MDKRKLNIPMLAALILLLLTMITTHMTSGLYARYSSIATASDSARVAEFKVSCNVVKNEDGTYSLNINNESEVSVKYDVHVKMDRHLSATVGGETKKLEDDEESVTFENEGWKLAPNTESDPLPLTFNVIDWTGLTDPKTDNGATEQVNLRFEVSVTAEQLD